MSALSPAAARVLANLLAAVDHDGVLEITNTMTAEALDRFNTFADRWRAVESIAARALHVRAMERVAAHWMAELTGLAFDDALAVMQSIADNPPDWVKSNEWREPTDDTRSAGKLH